MAVILSSSAVESSLFLLDCCKSVTLEINRLPAGVRPDWLGIYVVTWGTEKKFPMKYIQQPDRGNPSLHRQLNDGIWTFGGGSINSVDNATCPADIQQWQWHDDYGNFDGFGDISVKCI